MPGGDRSGPMGQGPRTGRGMGFCGSYEATGSGIGGRGCGFGFGGGRGARGGLRHRWFQTNPGRYAGWGFPTAVTAPDPEGERRTLRQEADALRRQLHDVEQRLTVMEGSGGSED